MQIRESWKHVSGTPSVCMRACVSCLVLSDERECHSHKRSPAGPCVVIDQRGIVLRLLFTLALELCANLPPLFID